MSCIESRGWIDSSVVRCALVLMMLTLPTCSGNLDEGSHAKETIEYYWADVNFAYFNPVTNTQEYETWQGKYGAKSLIGTRSGIAVHVRNKENEAHGCDEYENKLPQENWIALVERGKCYFADKIRVATEKYNASAIVIYNNVDDGMTIMQQSVEDQVSVFVTQELGQKLARLVDKGLRVMVTLSPSAPRPQPKARQSDAYQNAADIASNATFTVLFVALIFIFIFVA